MFLFGITSPIRSHAAVVSVCSSASSSAGLPFPRVPLRPTVFGRFCGESTPALSGRCGRLDSRLGVVGRCRGFSADDGLPEPESGRAEGGRGVDGGCGDDRREVGRSGSTREPRGVVLPDPR